MKKLGFTLAEVLITLAIIGIIAAVNIPTLLNNSSDQKNIVAWKKMYAELSQATQEIVYDNGGSLIGIFPGDTAGAEDLKNAYAAKLNAIKDCSGQPWTGGSGNGASTESCWHAGATDWIHLNGTTTWQEGHPGLILNNGSLMYFRLNKSDCSETAGDYTRCGWITVDINGFKQPNKVGKDIFSANITANSLVPAGARESTDPATNCVEGSTETSNEGWSCSSFYLYK